jgi:hypothetical protein
MSPYHEVGQYYNIRIANKLLISNVAKLQCFESTIKFKITFSCKLN